MKACTLYDPAYMRFKNGQNASMLLGRQAEVLSGHREERGWKGMGLGASRVMALFYFLLEHRWFSC